VAATDPHFFRRGAGRDLPFDFFFLGATFLAGTGLRFATVFFLAAGFFFDAGFFFTADFFFGATLFFRAGFAGFPGDWLPRS
jgi:hypothetical protein